jgi:hypothetical protein
MAYALIAAGAQAAYGLATGALPAFHGSMPTGDLFHDVTVFFDYATETMRGAVPYRDFRVEYPILAMPLFLAPRAFARDVRSFAVAFALEMLLFNALTVVLAARRVEVREGAGRVPHRLVWYSLSFACCCPVAIARFDLAVMAIGFASAIWWFSGREVAGGVAAGLGALLKVAPGAIAGPGLIFDLARFRRSRLRGSLAFAATIAAGAGLWMVLGGEGVVDSLRYQMERGIEVESLYAGLIMLAAKAAGGPLGYRFDHLATHVVSPLAAPTTALAPLVQASALLAVLRRFGKSGMRDGVRFSGAAILAFSITNKVFSPQYVLWMIPFVAVLEGRTGRLARPLFLAACLLTTVLYPLGFTWLLELKIGAILLLNLRNLLLVVLLGALLFGPEEDESRGVPHRSRGESADLSRRQIGRAGMRSRTHAPKMG